jgi:hypothetical protein
MRLYANTVGRGKGFKLNLGWKSAIRFLYLTDDGRGGGGGPESYIYSQRNLKISGSPVDTVEENQTELTDRLQREA